MNQFSLLTTYSVQWEKCAAEWRNTRSQDIQHVNFFQQEWQSSTCIEGLWQRAIDSIIVLDKTCLDFEVKLGIQFRWDHTHPEWVKVVKYISLRDYHHTIDCLEGLVVSRLFELAKMNQVSLCM
jgi:hypothetical protein